MAGKTGLVIGQQHGIFSDVPSDLLTQQKKQLYLNSFAWLRVLAAMGQNFLQRTAKIKACKQHLLPSTQSVLTAKKSSLTFRGGFRLPTDFAYLKIPNGLPTGRKTLPKRVFNTTAEQA